jgi:arylsulfatase A-like enzyme
MTVCASGATSPREERFMGQPGKRRQISAARISRRALLKSATAGALALAAACGGEEKPTAVDTSGTDVQRGAATAQAPAAVLSNGATAASVIVVVMDTLRADHVGAYGNDWIKTPTLDALAEESIVFAHAFPECIPTIPMRRTLHTGLRTWPFREWVPDKGDIVPLLGWQRIPEDQVTFAETLQFNGYQNGFVTDTFHYFRPSKNFHRGFQQFIWVRGQEADTWRSTVDVDPKEVEAAIPPGLDGSEAYLESFQASQYLANQAWREKEEDYQAPRVFQQAMNWLEENKTAPKFFLLVDSFDPHEPWDPPEKYLDLYADPKYDGPAVTDPRYGSSDNLTEAQLQHMRDRYAAEVTMTDHWFGRFLDQARDQGMLDNTLLVVTSDHGHQLGEHGLTGKVPRGLWNELTDVPLMVRRPDGVGAGTRVDSFVQHHDIAPTILGALGVAPQVAMPGMDLLALAADRVRPREHVSCGYHDYSWSRDGRYVYITRNDGTDQQLFDMEADPAQEHNLAEEEQGALRSMQEELLADAGGPLPV